jgi:hypothetical protein
MKQGVIRSQRSDEHKVLAVAIAQKEPLWKLPHKHQLNPFHGLLPYCHTTKQADLPHAFTSLLGFHSGAQGIHLVIISVSIDCKQYVSVSGLHTSCMVKSSSGGGRRKEGNHPPASLWDSSHLAPRILAKYF